MQRYDVNEPVVLSPCEDGEWVRYADAQATVEALQRERDEAIERAEQCRKDRAMVLTVKTTDGLTASEWLMRTAVAEQKAKDLQTALDAEREKVKGLHEATKVICGHCCEPMEIPSKAILQSQLSALQGLVRVYFTEEGQYHDDAMKTLRDERDRLARAIVWALGYTDFRAREQGEGAYWWRTELQLRAKLTGERIDAILAAMTPAGGGQDAK